MNATTPDWPLYLGCPVWSCGEWADQVYPPKTPHRDWLKWYSRTFNTVEGNSTFYACPSIETTRRWAEQTPAGFRFALKVPREITHERELVGAEEAMVTFLRAIEPLAKSDRLGPTFLQLGPRFGPDRQKVLEHFLHLLPRDLSWAVELRHHGWFDSGSHEHRVNDVLSRHRVDKVLFDSRPLFAEPPQDEIEVESQKRKPRTPVRQTVTGKHPMLRIVGRNHVESVERFIKQWVPIVVGWIRDGRVPYIFTHAPDDAVAPRFARSFAEHLQCALPDQDFHVPKPPKPASQLSLLD